MTDHEIIRQILRELQAVRAQLAEAVRRMDSVIASQPETSRRVQ